MSTNNSGEVVSQCEGLLDGLARPTDRETIYRSWSHLIPGAESGEQCRGNIRDSKKSSIVFSLRRNNHSSISAEVAETGIIEEGWTDYPRPAGRPTLVNLGRFTPVGSIKVPHRDVGGTPGPIILVPSEAAIDFDSRVELVIHAAIQIVKIRARWRGVRQVARGPGGIVGAGVIRIVPRIDLQDLLGHRVKPV